MEQGEHKISVLMVAFAAQGHINPMLILAKHLQSKANIQVTLATTEVFYHRLAQNHQTATTATPSNTLTISGVEFESFHDGFSLDYDRKSNLDTYMDTLAKVGPINLYNLIISLASNQTTPKKFSCIIISPFVSWVTEVATRLGIPCAMLWIQPCTLFAIYHSYYNKLNDFPTKENPHISVKLPCLPLLESCDLPSIVLPSNPLTSINESLSQAIKNVDNMRWVLANSFYELEKEVIEHMSKYVAIKAVGPLVPQSILLSDQEHGHGNDDQVGINMWTPEDKCIGWLNKNKADSVIYVSFGSLIVLSKEQIEIIGEALSSCKRPFLWIVKDYALGEGFLKETEEQGMVVKWCPQDKVLSHKSVGCFLTHCGWNSMLETISVGVPVIAYPFWTDQPTNAKLMSEIFGVGLRLWPNKEGIIEVGEIVKCIEEVMDGARAVGIRAKAAEWKRAAREAVAHGGSSDRNIQSFVDDIIEISSHVEYNVVK